MSRAAIPLIAFVVVFVAAIGAVAGGVVLDLRRQAAIAHADTTLTAAARFLVDGHYIPPQP